MCDNTAISVSPDTRLGECRRARGARSEAVEKYCRAVELYHSDVRHPYRCGLNDCSLRDFLKRHYPELVERRRKNDRFYRSDNRHSGRTP